MYPYVCNACRVASVEKNIINKLLACGRFFWLALYFTFDNVVWAGRMRIIDIEQRPFSVYALKSYLMSIFCQLILDCQQLYKTIKKIESLRLQENRKDCPFSEGKKLTQLTKNEDLPELFAKVSPVVELQLLKAKKKQLLISFFKNGLDITCAIEGTWGIGLNRGHIGVMNIVSALIAGYRIYKRCEMEQEDELKEKRRAEVLKQTSRKLSSTGNAHTKQKSKTKKKKAANKKRSSERGGSEQKLQ